MKNFKLVIVLFLIILSVSCDKRSELTSSLKVGTYSLTDEVYFDKPVMYTKGDVITDQKTVAALLNNVANTHNEAGIIDYFEFDTDYKKYNTAVEDVAVKILTNTSAIIVGLSILKDSVYCDIVSNSDGTYSLLTKDSVKYYTNGQNRAENLIYQILDFTQLNHYDLPLSSGYSGVYIGREKYTISFENNRLMLHEISFFIYSAFEGSYSIYAEANVIQQLNSAGLQQLNNSDTVLVQKKKFTFNKQ